MASPDHSPELDLRDYMRALWRRRVLIGLSILVAVAASLAASLLQPATYSASAELTLIDQPNDPFSSTTTAIVYNPDRNVQNEIGIINSESVRSRVRAAIGAAPSVQVASQGQTNTIVITAQTPQPDQAATVANTYARAYIDVKKGQAVDSLQRAVAQTGLKIDDLQRQIGFLDRAVADAPPSQQSALQSNLSAQRQSLVTQQTTYQQQVNQLELSVSLQTGGAQVTSPASPPGSASSPKPARSAVLAFALGLILGVSAALLFEYMDDSVRSKEEFEQAMGGLPTLGMIPRVESGRSQDPTVPVSLANPTAPASEAYRALRTSIQFLSVSDPVTVIEITSPNPGEGKTTTAGNLAIGLAQAGQRVCAVCCDLRRPRLHEFFGLSNNVGFTSVITGDSPLASALQAVPDVDGLYLLASGAIPPNPAELLSSRRSAEVFTALRAHFDAVLVDSSPVLAVTDAAVLVPQVDAVLLVANAGSTSRRGLYRAVELLSGVDAPLVGGVFNGVTADTGGYDYVKGYGSYRMPEPSSDGEAPADRTESGKAVHQRRSGAASL